MLIIAGHATVDPDRRDEYVAAFRDLVETSRAADGCLDVFVSADSLDPARVNVFERWESRDALDAWREQVTPPNIDIETTSDQVAMFDAANERSPFD